MARKLNNDEWKEYINKFNSFNGSVSVRGFCIENELTKSQFYYHKKRLENEDKSKNKAVFQAISLTQNSVINEELSSTSKEVLINVRNATIRIPISETTLIASIITELSLKC